VALRRPLCAWRGLLAGIVLAAPGLVHGQPPAEQQRPIRVGNINLLTAGGGYNSHDHPTVDSHGFVNLTYARRILRREMRAVPLWIRGALSFTDDERELEQSYTYWPDPQAGTVRGPETVQEQTSDTTVRAELLLDLVHNSHNALYGGAGVALHVVNFDSFGESSSLNGAAGLSTSESRVGPSVVAGWRLFMASQPFTLYAEARYGFTYGRAEGPQDANPKTAPGLEDFAVDWTQNVSFEGGLGLHW
jgi:hypothetical protein